MIFLDCSAPASQSSKVPTTEQLLKSAQQNQSITLQSAPQF